jgi:hypothetical protein
VIDETVLWRCIGNAEIMRTQLEYLTDLSTRPNIAIHIVPASVGAHAGLLGAFILADLEGGSGKVVYLETPDQGLVSDAVGLAASILGMFERVRSEALPRGASRELIQRVVSERWTP